MAAPVRHEPERPDRRQHQLPARRLHAGRPAAAERGDDPRAGVPGQADLGDPGALRPGRQPDRQPDPAQRRGGGVLVRRPELHRGARPRPRRPGRARRRRPASPPPGSRPGDRSSFPTVTLTNEGVDGQCGTEASPKPCGDARAHEWAVYASTEADFDKLPRWNCSVDDCTRRGRAYISGTVKLNDNPANGNRHVAAEDREPRHALPVGGTEEAVVGSLTIPADTPAHQRERHGHVLPPLLRRPPADRERARRDQQPLDRGADHRRGARATGSSACRRPAPGRRATRPARCPSPGSSRTARRRSTASPPFRG